MPRFARVRLPSAPTLRDVADALEGLQDNVEAAVQPSLAHPLIEGHILAAVAIATGGTDIAHLLQRPWSGWILTRKRGAGDVYEDTQTDPGRFLRLKSSSAVTVDLMVF